MQLRTLKRNDGWSDVKKTARLAKLTFSETEQEQLTQQLSQIIAYLEKLKELKLKGVHQLHMFLIWQI